MSTSTRFELPALNLNFGSITDGTDIPPPPDSPAEKTEKPTKKESDTSTTDEVKAVEKKPTEAAAVANGNSAGTKRPAEDTPPTSPSASHRAGSLRRMFSRTRMNNNSIEAPAVSNGLNVSVNGSRPVSRSGGSIMSDRTSKRASGWFRRLRGGDSKRSSVMLEPQSPVRPSISEVTTTSKPTGPPPPMIPEFGELEKDEGSLGNDLFKNIK